MPLDHEKPWIDERDIRPVPRWEVVKMIQECVTSEIGRYESTIVAPRHFENQQALKKIGDAVDGFKDLMKEVNGGLKVVKWAAAAVAAGLGFGGGIYAWSRVFGHS